MTDRLHDSAEREAPVCGNDTIRRTVPVLFEVDIQTDEATGHVYAFCSTACRTASTYEPIPGTVLEPGTDDLWVDGLVCEECEAPLDDVQHNDGDDRG